jgi:hypothetical protein
MRAATKVSLNLNKIAEIYLLFPLDFLDVPAYSDSKNMFYYSLLCLSHAALSCPLHCIVSTPLFSAAFCLLSSPSHSVADKGIIVSK